MDSMNAEEHTRGMTKKKQEGQKRRNKWSLCLLVLADKFKNPNFETWKILLII